VSEDKHSRLLKLHKFLKNFRKWKITKKEKMSVNYLSFKKLLPPISRIFTE
jgi:hypothetical protein